MPTLPQWHPLHLYMEVASVCAAAASSSDSGGPGGATSVYRSCCSEKGGRGETGVGVGERRGWTHSLLLITDQYIDWSPLIPDQFSPPLLSPLAHQSALQQPQVWGVEGSEERWMDGLSVSFSLSLSHSFFLTVRTQTGCPLHADPHTPDSPLVGLEDCTRTAGDGGSEQWNYNASSSNF